MVWGILAALISVLGGVVGVVKYLRRAEANRAALDTTTAERDFARGHVRQMETAAADARDARRTRLDEKATAVRGPDDAARLLREVTGADDPQVN
jgi:hypothetical protein